MSDNINIIPSGDSILISLPNGEGWRLKSDTNIFKIEKNIFLGNKKRIINSESVYTNNKLIMEFSNPLEKCTFLYR